MTAVVSGAEGRAGGYDAVSEWKHCGIGTSDDYDDNGGDSSVVGNAAKPNDRSKPLRVRSVGQPHRPHSDVAALRTTAPRTPVDALHPPGQPPQCQKSGRLRSPAYEQSYHRAPSGLLPAPRRRLRSVSPVSATSFASEGVRPSCVSKRQISLCFEFHSTRLN